MQTLDLTVVANRVCATSRAYLTYLKAHGYRPRKVLLVDFVGATPGTERVRRWFGAGIAFRALQRLQPVEIRREPLFLECCEAMQAAQEQRVDYFGPFEFHHYAEKYERCATTGYGEPGFQALLRRQPGALLYTSGGRVPAELADDARLRILHIHPGVVPMMRGSDGLLWSIAVRGKPGASCFYMDSGIDTGALIATMEFETPRFPRLAGLLGEHEELLYGALLHSYDPHLRAQMLIDVVRANPGRSLRELPSTPQAGTGGRSWFWMHPRLRRKILAEEVLC